MIIQKYKPGTNQEDRTIPALQPGYVSVEERSTIDLLKYAREYAKHVRFYNSDNILDGFWSSFLDFTDTEISELAQFADSPDIFKDDDTRLAKYSKPHLAMLLTFITLLKYPKEQFAELTAKNLEYFYKDVLKFGELDEIPDKVHVLFKLAKDVQEYVLKKGTLLNAGKDATGVNVQYEVSEDVTLNNAEISDIKTIHFTKRTADLKYIHETYNFGDIGFEKILCTVLGNITQLPEYITSYGSEISVTAEYLRTELYDRIKDKERDELETSDENYIFKALYFRSLKDFQYCLNLLYREINRGYVGITLPEDTEWEEAYSILENVHIERLSRARRAELKEIHRVYGFDSMMEFAFGEPEPWNMLYKMPEAVSSLAVSKNVDVLDALYLIKNEAAKKYIEHKLCMSSDDFAVVMEKKDASLNSIYGDEVYAILEAAWTKKRQYAYPAIGSDIIDGFYADTIYSENRDSSIERFRSFGKSVTAESSETINMGFAVSSPLLKLNEGDRTIEIVVSCKDGTIQKDEISGLLDTHKDMFNTFISTKDDWRQTDLVNCEIGKFIIQPELKTYRRENARIVCNTSNYSTINQSSVYKYIVFENGTVYEIEKYDEENTRIHLKSVFLHYESEKTRLISKLIPRTFISEMSASLKIDEYATSIKSITETFSENNEGNYFVDADGKIFFIKKFITADNAEILYCGRIESKDPLVINKIWKTIEPEYSELDTENGLNGMVVSEVYSAIPANAIQTSFEFDVSDRLIRIKYPEGAKAGDILTAWEKWNDNPLNTRGRFDIVKKGNPGWDVFPLSQEIEKTGELIKRYESIDEKGLRITFKGRPADTAKLVITDPSAVNEHTAFLVSGGLLTITHGTLYKTANQIVAEWQEWILQPGNDASGFSIESKDTHQWQAAPVDQMLLTPIDKRIKKCEISDLYGNGIRVLYSGQISDTPKVIIVENEIDLFEFTIKNKQNLTIKYPSLNITSSHDLVEAWTEWKNSELNDPGYFDIEAMGDEPWTVYAQSERELQSSENQVMECTVADTGFILMYNLSTDYPQAKAEFLTGTKFGFEFRTENKVQILTAYYPSLAANSTESERVLHLQNFMSTWNRLYKKHGFAIVKKDETAKWNNNPPALVDFSVDLNYVHTMNPDGFRIKYKPYDNFKAKVVLLERKDQEGTVDTFEFHVTNDFPNNARTLYINYPILRKNRTVKALLDQWKIIQTNPEYAPLKTELSGFSIVQSGTGKWEIEGITERALTSETTSLTEVTDPVIKRFFEYRTDDIDGFSLLCTAPEGTSPRVTMLENDNDSFAIDVTTIQNAFYNVNVDDSITIRYPKRKDKRTVVNLLKTWIRTRTDNATRPFRFEIIDTSPVVRKRAEAELCVTGDAIHEYSIGTEDLICITYTGHRKNVSVKIEQITDFADENVGKKLVWDTGEIFLVKERLDTHRISIEPAGDIERIGEIKLYNEDALCLNAIKFTITLDKTFPAIVPLKTENISPWPVIKILLNCHGIFDGTSSEAVFYEYFKSIFMERIDLKVAVKGLSDIQMRGDLAKINSQNPFTPFGTSPNTSARFYFANSEICEKKIDSLDVHFEWAESEHTTEDGIPDMAKHYYAYSHCGIPSAGTVKNDDFELNLTFFDQRTWVDISDTPATLFNKSLSYNDFEKHTYRGDLFPVSENAPSDPIDWPRYYKMELGNQGFMKDLHIEVSGEVVRASNNVSLARSTYNSVALEIKKRIAEISASKIAEAEARTNGTSYVQPIIPEARQLPSLPENDKDIQALVINQPYSPTVKSMHIDYSASAKIILNNSSATTATTMLPVRVFRYEPFGYAEPGSAQAIDSYLLPQYDKQGYLLVGLKNVQPLQSVSLLVQMISGSGDATRSIPDISWSYLSSDKWIPFDKSDILKDMTFGLQDSGIVRIRIPENATTTNTIVDSGRIWIRAEAENNITAVPDILDIQTQAVSVIFVNNGNDPDRLETPLLSESIHELVTRDSSIKEVTQPYSSFNGQKKEGSKDFYVRVSERLKHKNRPLTVKDYENMILSRFPEIYKVKCIPQGELKILDSTSEGEVLIIVIIKNANAAPFFPLKPKTPATILDSIKTYITEFMPPLVTVSVRNPRFEEIRYRLAVKFKEGYDQGFYINKINDDIKQFLSPWAYKKEESISFGSSVYSSSVINYLEKRDYIDYVANFTLHQQIIAHETFTEIIPLFLTDDNSATVRYPDSVLVSADNHIIDVIRTDLYDAGAFRGIGYMKIGDDFWISRPGPVFSVGLGEMEIESWAVPRYAFVNMNTSINATGTINNTTFEKSIITTFSYTDSQFITNALKNAGYIDDKGNISAATDLFSDNFSLKLSDGTAFNKYLTDNLAQFSFVVKATDFNPSAKDDDQFSYIVNELVNPQTIEDEVLKILRTGFSYSGISQYPFMVS